MKKVEFLSATQALYKKGETDLTDDLNSVDGDEIDDSVVVAIFKKLDAEKVTTLKGEATKRFNDGVGKGTKDAAKKFEDKLADVFNIEDKTLKGDDLLDHIETEVVPLIGAGGSDAPDFKKITADDLDKIPAVKKLKQEHAKALTAKETEKADAIKAEQDKQSQTSLLGDIVNNGLTYLDGRKPVLDADAAKAKNQKDKLFVNELKAYKFGKDEKGNVIPVDEDGNQLEDSNGNLRDVASLYAEIADNNFTFNVATQRTSPSGKPTTTTTESKKYVGAAPKNQDEYMNLITDDSLDSEVRASIMETYSDQFA